MKNNNIIIVDDDMCYLQLLKSFIESKGFNVTITANGASALKLIDTSRFSMMITDYNMPGMNGVELAKKVQMRYPEICIVMITGSFLPEVVEAAANASISRILSKPVNILKLMSVIRSTLRI